MDFAERMGFVPPKIVQFNDMDEKLRNSLWNVFYLAFFDKERKYDFEERLIQKSYFNEMYKLIWEEYFIYKINAYPDYLYEIELTIHDYFFDCDWIYVYSFIEFIVNNVDKNKSIDLQNQFNIKLANQLSGYRFINGFLAPITSEIELQEIQKALENSEKFKYKGVNEHIAQAIAHLSNKENPDYRNVIKESISAVESIARIIVKKPRIILGKAIATLQSNNVIEINSHLLVTLDKISTYTNEVARHAVSDDTKMIVKQEEAIFMLVTCSAFVNYLITKNENLKLIKT